MECFKNYQLRYLTVILAFVIVGCGHSTSNNKSLEGNVYVLSDGYNSLSRNVQLQAFRIDAIKGDTLLVKYRIGSEAFMDSDFLRGKSANDYKSLYPLVYGMNAQLRDSATLYLTDSLLTINLYSNKGTIKVNFVKRYNKPVNLKTHRAPYHAEDGFSLEL